MSWPEYRDVTARSFVLRPDAQIFDPKDFAYRHEDFLLPLDGPSGAAAWHDRVSLSGGYAEGNVSLESNGRELVDPRLWTTVDGFWRTIASVLEKYAEAGEGMELLEDQPVEIGLQSIGSSAAKFWVGEGSVVVTESFVYRLAQAALEFFSWMREYVGGVGNRDFEAIQELVERLRRNVCA